MGSNWDGNNKKVEDNNKLIRIEEEAKESAVAVIVRDKKLDSGVEKTWRKQSYKNDKKDEDREEIERENKKEKI